jgi:hypothetical protein
VGRAQELIMALFPQVDVFRKGEDDVLDTIAGLAPRDVEPFIGQVATQLAAILHLRPVDVRARLAFDVRDSVRCRPIGTGPSAAAEAEIRAVAREVAEAIAPHFQEDAAREHAA